LGSGSDLAPQFLGRANPRLRVDHSIDMNAIDPLLYPSAGLAHAFTSVISSTGVDFTPRVLEAFSPRSLEESAKGIKNDQHVEEALRQSEERFRLLVEGVKDYAIFMLCPDGRIASWNAGAERIKGYRAEEIIGQHFSCFYTPEDLQQGKPGRAR